MWRHGCRHRAYMDVLATCPASGEDTAPSTHAAFDLDLIRQDAADKTTALTDRRSLARFC
ncbi:hypothetical protein XHV734_2013 [Xanthomonas hortorum pv. vitians]|nr:hypothetical protein XHV734_2013 [Xanthomonas hortorum pv. vitians]